MMIVTDNINIAAVFKRTARVSFINELKIDNERIIRVVTTGGRQYSIDDVDYFLIDGVRKEKNKAFEILKSIF
ncbi:hypothetical protein [Sulfurimonas sp.]|uniref:hypothetical protein n=1 Tax=Sulfurimonas sp. TaxID=2022749 RepID=UPI002625FE91|nr:hypothetical protein [Sulfurimonas sp.]MDD3856390.1 hypothetical protein [Sulfurimonas sp.]